MRPLRFRTSSLLLATTILALLLGAVVTLNEGLLVALAYFAVFLAVLLAPQWLLANWSTVSDESRSSASLLLAALSLGPGSLGTAIFGFLCVNAIGETTLIDPILMIQVVGAMHVAAVAIFLLAIVEQTRKRRFAGVLLNAFCLTFIVIVPAFIVSQLLVE